MPPFLTNLRERTTTLVARVARSARENPASAVLALLGIAATVYVVAYPFTVVTYPPITDLPFHAAEASIVRHYFDPAYHFREQFEIHFLEVPYAALYLLCAFFALFLPIVWAVKLTAIVLLSLLPAGLAVFFYGMKKSPLLGLLGLGMVWSLLTHWGFLNFMGAIGLFAMVAGCTLMALDRPTRGRQLRLGLALFGVFFTHIYRFPFAVALVFGITLVMYPATRKVKPVVAPVVAALTLYVLWTFVRQPGIPTDLGPLSLHFDRIKQIPEFMFAAFTGPEELDGASEMLGAAVVLFVLNALIFFLQRRQRDRTFRELWWGGAVTALPLLIGVVFLGVYLTFPMSIGGWWFVFPREITTTAYISLAAVPDLPRQWWIRGPMLALIVLLTGRQALGTARQWDAFETSNADFRAIVKSIPRAPKLLYLVFDHSGSTRQVTPFIHMPAWVQAEKGGWLSFHFAIWGDVNPVRYRKGPSTPPPTPDRWEWTPERFKLEENAPFFDTFLVRSLVAPDALFARDTSIQPAGHQGKWWLYRRSPASVPALEATH